MTRWEAGCWSAVLTVSVLLWLALILWGWHVAVLCVVAIGALGGAALYEGLRAQ